MKQKIFIIVMCAWVALWVLFIGRDLFMKGSFETDRQLWMRSLEGKRSYIMGKRLYDLLSLAAWVMPEKATYKIVGLEYDSLDKRRADYYLCPRIENDDADFILVYDSQVAMPGYEIAGDVGNSCYILKKKEAE